MTAPPPAHTLKHAADYIASRYGGTLAHHIISQKLKEVSEEPPLSVEECAREIWYLVTADLLGVSEEIELENEEILDAITALIRRTQPALAEVSHPIARVIGALYTIQGIVRNLWCQGEFCDITFEHESNEVSVIKVYEAALVWAGEHVRITLRHMEPPWDRIVNTERLP